MAQENQDGRVTLTAEESEKWRKQQESREASALKYAREREAKRLLAEAHSDEMKKLFDNLVKAGWTPKGR